MDTKSKQIEIGVFLLLLLLLTPVFSQVSGGRVTREQLNDYILTYIEGYRLIAQNTFNESQLNDLALYSNYPYVAEGIIWDNGVTIRLFTNQTVYLLDDSEFINYEDSTMILSGYVLGTAPESTEDHCAICGDLSGLSIQDNNFDSNSSVIIIGEGSEEVNISNNHYHRIIVFSEAKMLSIRNVTFEMLSIFKPSLNSGDYTKEKAIEDLQRNFREALVMDYLNKIIEVSKNLSNSIFEEKARALLEKVQKGAYVNKDFDLDSDYKALADFGNDHGIKQPDLHKASIYSWQSQSTEESRKNPLEKHPIETILLSILGGWLLNELILGDIYTIAKRYRIKESREVLIKPQVNRLKWGAISLIFLIILLIIIFFF
jgi:hypothetical protein